MFKYLKRYIRVWHLPVVSDEPGADIGDLASEDNPAGELHALLEEMQEAGVDL